MAEEKMEKIEEKEQNKKEISETKKNKESKKKKIEAIVNSYNLPISTKTSSAICKFIKGKTIEDASKNLKKVIMKKIPIPMKGEIPHRKGKIMSGRYPKIASEHFLNLLKTLSGNANINGIENPIISEAIANIASRPYSKFGRVRKKRTHIKLVAREHNKHKSKIKE